jgi:hypothetical protein
MTLAPWMSGGPSWLPEGRRQDPFGMAQPQIGGVAGLLKDPSFALALLANSRGQRFGQAVGNAGLQAQQMGQQREESELMRQYREAQIESLRRGGQSNVYGAVQPDKFTPDSLAKFEQTGKYSDLVLRPLGIQYGRYNPGDFTPESWASFVSTGDPSSLVRYVAPANPTVKDVGGVPTVVQPSRTGGPTKTDPLSTLDNEAAAAARIAGDKAAATATGEAAGANAAKAPVKASFDYVVSQFRPMLKETMQGMVQGPAGWVFDYGDKRRFGNLREQLSTELRTVFRIPGEGTLTNQEQAQYGLQLPDTSNPPDVNEKILNDLEERIRLRTQTPIPGATPQGQGKKRRYNPQTGRIE